MTWADLYVFLQKLVDNQDSRLTDTVQVYNIDQGEFEPVDVLELEPDDVLSTHNLFLYFPVKT